MNVDDFVEGFNSAGDFSELERLVEIGKVLAEECEGHEKGRVLGTLGNIYYALQRFEEAEKAYLDALQLYIKLAEEKEDYTPYVVGCLYNLGNLYQAVRKYAEAEKAYTDALKLIEDGDQKLPILTALGTMYAKLDIHNLAERYLVEAFNIAKTTGDARQVGMLLNNLAVVYLRSGRKREAGMILRMALDALERCGEDESLAAVLQNLLPFLDDEEIERVMNKLERFKNLPLDLEAKIVYFKARKAEHDGNLSPELYMRAGCLAFLAYRNFGYQSINFMHCFDRVIEAGGELGEDALTLKKLILRYYYGSQKVELKLDSRVGRMLVQVLQGGEIEADEPLVNVLKVIAQDLARAGDIADITQ